MLKITMIKQEYFHAGPYINEENTSQELRTLYPIAKIAENLGVCYFLEKDPEEVLFRSSWCPLGIRKESYLGLLLQMPFIERTKKIGQLGPNARYPYPYTHSVYEHTAEQLVRGVARMAHITEAQKELFMNGTREYLDPAASDSEHIAFILQVIAWSILIHDSQSLPLRDTAKFAFKVRAIETDENKLIVQKLIDSRDTKYRPFIEKNFGARANLVINILSGIAMRSDETILGDLLHSRSLLDISDKQGKSRPLDIDRITYTIHDLLSIFGDLIFDKSATKEGSEKGVWLMTGLYTRLQNLQFMKQLQEELSGSPELAGWQKLFQPVKVNPAFIDLTCTAKLGVDEKGAVRIGYDDPSLLNAFLYLTATENFPTLYLHPALIFTEKRFEQVIKNKIRKWNLPRRQRFLERLLDWSDQELMFWLEKYCPEALAEIHDDKYIIYEYFAVSSDEPLVHVEEIEVPVNIHAATSTHVMDINGQAKPFWEHSPEATAEFRDTLALYDVKRLKIRRVKKKVPQLQGLVDVYARAKTHLG